MYLRNVLGLHTKFWTVLGMSNGNIAMTIKKTTMEKLFFVLISLSVFYFSQSFSCKKDATPIIITVSTLAGSGTAEFADVNCTSEQFQKPTGMALNAQGNIYVADFYNNCIRKITASGLVSILAGSGTEGFADDNGMLIGAGMRL